MWKFYGTHLRTKGSGGGDGKELGENGDDGFADGSTGPGLGVTWLGLEPGGSILGGEGLLKLRFGGTK